MRTETVRSALRISTVTNLSGGLGAILAPTLHTQLFYGVEEGMSPLLLLDHRLLWSFVAIMGIAFGFASRDPDRSLGLLLAGGIGKLTACGLWLAAIAPGEATPLVALAVAIDGGLALAFLGYLRAPNTNA